MPDGIVVTSPIKDERQRHDVGSPGTREWGGLDLPEEACRLGERALRTSSWTSLEGRKEPGENASALPENLPRRCSLTTTRLPLFTRGTRHRPPIARLRR